MDQKRFFLGLSAVFLGLAWIVDADAMKGPDITSCNAGWNFCSYLSTNGKTVYQDGTTVDLLPGADGYLPMYNSIANYFSSEKKYVMPAWYGGQTIYAEKMYALGMNSYTWILQDGTVKFYDRDWTSPWVWWGAGNRTNVVNFGLGDTNGDRTYVYSDGTSNVCSGTDNVRAELAIGSTNQTICFKADGSVTNTFGVAIPNNPDSIDFTSISGWGQNPLACWTKNGVAGCSPGMVVPSGSWRNISVTTNYEATPVNYACAVRTDDNIMRCWNASGTIVYTAGGATPEPPAPPGPETYTKGSMSCVTEKYPKISETNWMEPGFMNWAGTYSVEVYEGKSNQWCTGWLGNDCGDIIYFRGKSDNGVSEDQIILSNYDTGSVIRPDSWKPPSVASGPRSTLIADLHEPQNLMIRSYRNGINYRANVYEFSNVSNPSSVEPWANYFDDYSKTWIPVYASGWLAKIPLRNGQTKIILNLLEFTVPPIGFRMGYSEEYYDQTTCSTAKNPCRSTLVGANWECRGGYANGYYGRCAYDTDGACSPIVSTGGVVETGTPEDGAIVIRDSNGNVVSVRPADSALKAGWVVDVDSVFSCSYYRWFLDIFSCGVTITNKIVKLIYQSVVGANGNGGIQKIGTDIGSGATATGGVTLTPVNDESDNLADYMFRHSWNRATDSELSTPFTNWGKFALYGSLFVALLGVLATIAFVNRR